MTVNEAIIATQKRKAGFVNQTSVQYAETQLLPGEEVIAAVVANIVSKRYGSFPGVVVITDQHIMAVCGMPGIKRCIKLLISELERCEETSTALQYKATFTTRKDGFGMSVDPDVGNAFTQFVSQMNGEELEAVKLEADGNILNPNFLSRKKLNKERRERERDRELTRDVNLQKKAAEAFDSMESDI